ncbi:hypothetical protein [Pedobacter frigidisoli]|uniref:hypothetical protein n=1 Tax=Pedobacter frigidisoli TaxID=2530455 RepID=UPI00292CDB2F|nr:hypothetical protein [Pedobacter frigidisoli]
MLEKLLDVAGTNPYKHLIFLSSKHATDVVILRFTQTAFLFFFLIQIEKNYHTIWDTYTKADVGSIRSIIMLPRKNAAIKSSQPNHSDLLRT